MQIESYYYEAEEDLILLPGKITGSVCERNIRLVFDPGSYRTIIDTQLIDQLGYQATGESRKLTTGSISGKEHGYTVTLDHLEILTFTFTELEVASFDLPEEYGIDGLLGLDLLEQFQVTFKHQEHWIQLQRLELN